MTQTAAVIGTAAYFSLGIVLALMAPRPRGSGRGARGTADRRVDRDRSTALLHARSASIPHRWSSATSTGIARRYGRSDVIASRPALVDGVRRTTRSWAPCRW